ETISSPSFVPKIALSSIRRFGIRYVFAHRGRENRLGGRQHLRGPEGIDARKRAALLMRLGAVPEAMEAAALAKDEAHRGGRRFGRIGHEAPEVPAASDDHGRHAEADREMRGSGVVAENERRPFQEIEKLRQAGHADA